MCWSKFLKKLFQIIILFGLFFGLNLNFVRADIGIAVYPLSYRIVLSPGQSWEGLTTVVNPNDFPLKVKVEKENIIGGAEGNVSLTPEEVSQYGLTTWISYDSNELILQPQERKEFHYKVTIPENAPPGGHYAAILFRGGAVESGSSGIGVSGRTGTVILVEVTGDVVKKAEINSISAPKFISHGPLEISFKIKNEGNSYIFPEGKVLVSGIFQKKELSWEPRIVFPGFERTFGVKWDRVYLFGPLKVTVNALIPNGPALEPVKITVWAFPYQQAIIILLILILIIWGEKSFKKKFKIVRVEEKKESNTDK
ncbi:MAG: hypothetical protein ACPLKV_00155 [Minisyncoccia bacterium]